MTASSELDRIFDSADAWQEEAIALRAVLLESGLTEERKWGKPCYTQDGRNICILQRMKGFLALLFFKGAMLKDPARHLEVQGPNSRIGYRLCFTSVAEVERLAPAIRDFVHQAVEIERSGRSLDLPKPDLDLPEELIAALEQDPDLQAGFDALTPGRQRSHVLHIASAKQAATRQARAAKCRATILAGKGFNER